MQTATSSAPSQPHATGKLRAGVVGVGRMGRHHARVYQQLAQAELVGVVDENTDRREAIAEERGCNGFATVDQLLAAGVDIVSVAVPTSYHRSVAEPLLKAGVACLIEKPLAGSVEDATAIKEIAEKSGAVLMVGHIERFNPIMVALRRETENGRTILPRFIEVHRVSPMTFRSVDTSVVMDMMIHDLDVVIMLMGGREPDEVQASGVPVVTEHEDVCNARLTWRTPHGACVATISTSRLALKTERVTRITGENAYVKIDYAAKKGTLIRRTANEVQMKEVRELLRKGQDLSNLKWHELVNIEELEVGDAEPIVAEIENFIQAVRTGTRPEVDATAGLANVRTAQRIVDAARKEREWKWPG
ncbi:MAG: Gfo/Idh/MocA family oxidoreductase [Phycisphaerales bacterium]